MKNVVKLLNKNWGNPASSIRNVSTSKQKENSSGMAKVGVFDESIFVNFAQDNNLEYTRVSKIEYLVFIPVVN